MIAEPNKKRTVSTSPIRNGKNFWMLFNLIFDLVKEICVDGKRKAMMFVAGDKRIKLEMSLCKGTMGKDDVVVTKE